MSQLDFLRSLRAMPNQVRATSDQLRVTHGEVVMTESQVAELRATVEASSKAQLEALRFLTRSVNELSARIDKLERRAADTTG
jgi:methyl-accepting chemotaxis protein